MGDWPDSWYLEGRSTSQGTGRPIVWHGAGLSWNRRQSEQRQSIGEKVVLILVHQIFKLGGFTESREQDGIISFEA